MAKEEPEDDDPDEEGRPGAGKIAGVAYRICIRMRAAEKEPASKEQRQGQERQA